MSFRPSVTVSPFAYFQFQPRPCGDWYITVSYQSVHFQVTSGCLAVCDLTTRGWRHPGWSLSAGTLPKVKLPPSFLRHRLDAPRSQVLYAIREDYTSATRFGSVEWFTPLGLMIVNECIFVDTDYCFRRTGTASSSIQIYINTVTTPKAYDKSEYSTVRIIYSVKVPKISNRPRVSLAGTTSIYSQVLCRVHSSRSQVSAFSCPLFFKLSI